jgi:ABC-type sugar transport system ATPase subunit
MAADDSTGGRAGTRFGVQGATQVFAGVTALRDVDFEMREGSVHGLVGENGSGKSTLIRILTGALRPTKGRLFLEDETVSFSLPAEAQRHGIGVVHQDYNLFPDLSVSANVLGVSKAPPRRRWTRGVDKGAVERQVSELLTGLGIRISPRAKIRDLGPAERKFVEIARAMLLRPRFLILDEPTASLEPRGSRSVLDLLKRLRSQGVGLCFVSHRLDEVLGIADRISVLRDGRLVEAVDNKGLTENEIAELIIGRKQVSTEKQTRAVSEGVMLRARGIRLRNGTRPVEFEVRRGEIFGLTGLLGSGAAEVVRMLGGAIPLRGELEVEGGAVTVRNPRDAARRGIGFIPEDRKDAGLVGEQSMAVNVSLASLSEVAPLGWVRRGRLTTRALELKRTLDIRTPSVAAAVKTLSGGNQQKVMLAKWLASGVRILAIEEPTHGVDIGAKSQVHQLLRDFATNGGTIVVASTDVNEVLAVCDRIGVMRHGALADVLSTERLTHQDLAVMGGRSSEHVLEELIESGSSRPEPNRVPSDG